MKVEQLNSQQIDWTKPQVVVANNGAKMQVVTNQKPIDDSCFSGVDLKTGVFGCGWSKDVFKPETSTDYPIEIKLTIESDEELCNLYLRSSVNQEDVDKCVIDNTKYNSNNSDQVLYELLDSLITQRNLCKND